MWWLGFESSAVMALLSVKLAQGETTAMTEVDPNRAFPAARRRHFSRIYSGHWPCKTSVKFRNLQRNSRLAGRL